MGVKFSTLESAIPQGIEGDSSFPVCLPFGSFIAIQGQFKGSVIDFCIWSLVPSCLPAWGTCVCQGVEVEQGAWGSFQQPLLTCTKSHLVEADRSLTYLKKGKKKQSKKPHGSVACSPSLALLEQHTSAVRFPECHWIRFYWLQLSNTNHHSYPTWLLYVRIPRAR